VKTKASLPFFGFFRTTPENVSRDTIAIIGSKCVSRSIHPLFGQHKSTEVLRKLSYELCTHNLQARTSLENYDIVDLGDFKPSEITTVVVETLKRGARILVIGGDHTTTYYALRNIDIPHLTIFDAHLDLEECSEKFHHGCVARKLLEENKKLSINFVGLRGYSTLKDEIEFAELLKQRIIPWPVSRETMRFFISRSRFISIDLDFLSPKSFPAVRVPEALGPDVDSFLALISSIESTSAIYVDVVEYAPEIDPGYSNGKVLLQLVLEILALLARS